MAPTNIITSPLRYPGSKSSLTDYVASVIEANLLSGCTIYEPYAGSAAVSLEMLARGYASQAVLVERDPLIFAFWKCVFEHTEHLIESIYELHISMDTWHYFNQYRKASNLDEFSILEMGLAGLFFNRTNFSGILSAGPIGGLGQKSKYTIDCRFNKQRIIDQITLVSRLAGQVEVIFGDALEFLSNNRQSISEGFSFVYLDPPYFSQGKKLYRYFYENDDHKALAEHLLMIDTPWLVSYDDHPSIREFYEDTRIAEIYIDYTVKTSRRGEELLISNLIIPPLTKQNENKLPRNNHELHLL